MRVTRQPAAPGEFLCRAPPQPGYVSTLEAIGRTLLSLDEDGFGACAAFVWFGVEDRTCGARQRRTQRVLGVPLAVAGRAEYDAILAPLREMVRVQERHKKSMQDIATTSAPKNTENM